MSQASVSGALTSLNLASNNLAGETDWINPSEVQGDSKEVGATVTYQGRQMTVGRVFHGDIKLTDLAGVRALSAALEVNGALTSIDLRGNRLGTGSWCAIFNALRDNKENKIASWDLSHQDIDAEAVKAIAEYVAVSGALTSLNLSGNRTT